MFSRIGRFVARRPWPVIAAWIVAAAAVIALAPGLDEVTTGDQESFVPDSYESVQADQLAAEAFPEQTATGALLVFSRADGAPLTQGDQVRVVAVTEELSGAGIDRVIAVATAPEALSPDGTVQLAQVALDGEQTDTAVLDSVPALRAEAASLLSGGDLRFGMTGDAAMLYDSQEAFLDAERIVGIVTIVLILGLLLLIFRSPVAALLPVLAVALVLMVSSSLIAALFSALDRTADQDLPILLTVVLYGIGTDYTLFLLFRYRERLRAGDTPWQAIATAVARVGEVITSAASVVIIAFLAMLLAVLGMLPSFGLGMAIAVAVMALAVMTLIPALVTLIGPRVFWPSRSWRRTPDGALPRRVGDAVARRPLVAAVSAGVLLVGLAAAAFAYTPNYDFLDQLPADTESVEAFEKLQEGFPAGALNPTQVYVRSDDGTPLGEEALAGVAGALQESEGVSAVLPPEPNADGSAARIDLLLEERPLSNSALDAVDGPLREVAHAAAPEGTSVLVGGSTATFADMRDAFSRDLSVIIPVAAVLILVVLALLVRSLVAPWYLMAAVMVTFGASLGIGVLAVQTIGGEAGLVFILPIMLYLFVIAIGTDYNILMVARLREEARHGATPREAVARAVEHAGPAVAAAAVILAGTFSSLLVSGVGFLVQLGLTVALGILMAAVMALFLVPGLTALVGRAAWWPGAASRQRPGPPDAGSDAAVAPRQPRPEPEPEPVGRE